MVSEILLAFWSGAGLAWWLVASRLAAADQGTIESALKPTPERTLSVFKPLPPLGRQGLEILTGPLESFVAQLDSQSELLLGIHEADRNFTSPFLVRLRSKYPKARLKFIFRSAPDDVANPKIAWEKILAPEATGDLWLWSDADILAPVGFLQAARTEYARSGAALMTFPYVIRDLPSQPALLEALFVNVEFYPGVLLLRRLGPVDFGLGAAMLFRRDDFLERVDWNEIGAWLADDFFLGQKLRPARVGTTKLATVPGATTWKDAVLHDLRWTKTVRWNRPIGFFGRILTMPVLGWLGMVAVYPTHIFAWLGLLFVVQAEVFFAWAICRKVGCPLHLRHLPAMELWSLWRMILWFLCWLPWPILWRGKMWPGPKVEFIPEMNPTETMTEPVDNHLQKSDLLKNQGL